MRIATWNVNSLNKRMPRVEEWLEYAHPDVLCLQETKLSDANFPSMAFAALGYEAAHCGQGQWNGVAILSRVGLDDVIAGFSDQTEDEVTEARLLWATCSGWRSGGWSTSFAPSTTTTACTATGTTGPETSTSTAACASTWCWPPSRWPTPPPSPSSTASPARAKGRPTTRLCSWTSICRTAAGATGARCEAWPDRCPGLRAARRAADPSLRAAVSSCAAIGPRARSGR